MRNLLCVHDSDATSIYRIIPGHKSCGKTAEEAETQNLADETILSQQ